MKLITILLATYNGEKYLHVQLESLLKQTYTNWRLFIRDDNSTDNTPKILFNYQQQYPDKIIIVPGSNLNIGSVLNFSNLLTAAHGSEYIMFCDQDDYWLPGKIAETFSKICELELQLGKDHPVMVFTDFSYVDEYLNVIELKKKFTVNQLKNIGFPQMLVQNPAYGCTTLINGSLAEKVKVIPPEAENHDYWIALVASAFGTLYYLPQKTILYRQHASNVSGNFDNSSLKKRMQRIIINRKNIKILNAKKPMYLQFRKLYYSQLNKTFQNIFDDFIAMYNGAPLVVIVRNLRNGVRSQTTLQTILLYVSFFFYKSKDVH